MEIVEEPKGLDYEEPHEDYVHPTLPTSVPHSEPSKVN